MRERNKVGKIEGKGKLSYMLRATLTGVAIRGVIPITAKIAPQRQTSTTKNQDLTKVAKCHPRFWVAYLTTLERE